MNKITFCFLTFFSVTSLFAQTADELLKMVDEKPMRENVTATFKTTRLINFHTIEVLGKRSLDFRISHRFGDVSSGFYNAWGIDGGANIRLGLEYSHDSRLMFGLGRTSAKKIVDGFVKYRLLKQTNDNHIPVSVTLFTSIYDSFEKAKINGQDKFEKHSERLSYCHQILIGRKFNSKFSLQLLGAAVHYNLVEAASDKNDCYVAGIVTRYKFGVRHAITFEYGYRLNKYTQKPYYDSFGIGYDLETGGHVFQIHLTNSFGLTENEYFMNTTSTTTWSKFGMRLGFNVSRVFTLKKHAGDWN